MNPLTNKWGLLAAALTIIVFCGALVLVLVPAPKTPLETATSTAPLSASTTTEATSTDLSNLIVVTSPKEGAVLASSTLVVTGTARGSWYFEASFPVYLVDWDGKIIAQGTARAQGDWMTTDFVPFVATLSYTKPQGGPEAARGAVILHNDNPSGDPTRDKALEIPIYFSK